MGTPAHRAGPWKRAVVGLPRLAAGTDIGQQASRAGARTGDAPFSLVVDGNHGAFEYHPPPRCAALGTTSALAASGLDTGRDQRRGISGKMGSRVRLRRDRP